MDIREDLKRISSKEISADDIVKDLWNQQNELKIKSHLFIALFLANSIEDTIKNKLFENTEITLIILEFLYDTEEGLGFIVNFSFHDDKKNIVSKQKYQKQANLFKDAFLKIQYVDIQLTNKEELQKLHRYEIKSGIGEKFLNLFLSKELKSIYDYNKMQLELEESKDNKSKKLKV